MKAEMELHSLLNQGYTIDLYANHNYEKWCIDYDYTDKHCTLCSERPKHDCYGYLLNAIDNQGFSDIICSKKHYFVEPKYSFQINIKELFTI